MKNDQMKIGFIAVYTILLCLGGCSPSDHAKREIPAFSVEIGEVKKQEIPIYIQAIGNAYSPNVIDIVPQVSGMLLKNHVPDGEKVQQGEVLFSIDPRPFQAALKNAEGTLQKDLASLDLARKRLDRFTSLVEQDFVSHLDYDQYVADVESLEGQVVADRAAVETATIELGYCTIAAPISGVIGLNNIKPGNIVYPNNITRNVIEDNFERTISLTTLRQLSPLEIRFTLSQGNFQKLKAARLDETIFDVRLPGTDLREEGKVNFIDNKVDLGTGTILLKGNISNEHHRFWPGEFVNVSLLLKKVPDVLVIPLEALQIGQKGDFVYVVDPNFTVEAREVQVLARIGDIVAVQEGLSLGEKVVTNGQVNLFPGAKVSIKQKGQTDGGA